MAQVAPSIFSADFANLEADCRRVMNDETPYLHFDVMDGVFVPNITFGHLVLQSLKKAIPDTLYDVHLMITKPLPFIERFAKAGADSITFHIEANSPVQETIDAIHAAGCDAGLSLRPGTPIEALFPYLSKLEMVLVMSVEPGFGGQKFMPEAPERIRRLRAEAKRQNVELVIEVDGGIDPATGPLCIGAGADLLVAGSSVFGSDDSEKTIDKILGKG